VPLWYINNIDTTGGLGLFSTLGIVMEMDRKNGYPPYVEDYWRNVMHAV